MQKGELFGFLGVNGAGKSTTIRMMCTLFSPTDGEIWIGGQQVGVHDEEIRQKIGVVWQENVLDDRLTVKENLQVRAAMYQTKRAWQRNAFRQLRKLHLEDIYTRRYAKLSGGQKRRCEIAASTANDPEVLFLDEPTTGLESGYEKASLEQRRITSVRGSGDGFSDNPITWKRQQRQVISPLSTKENFVSLEHHRN